SGVCGAGELLMQPCFVISICIMGECAQPQGRLTLLTPHPARPRRACCSLSLSLSLSVSLLPRFLFLTPLAPLLLPPFTPSFILCLIFLSSSLSSSSHPLPLDLPIYLSRLP